MPPDTASLAYFCPTCGEVWARLPAGATWQAITAPCALHAPRGVADWNRVPGSVVARSVTKDHTACWEWAATVEYLQPDRRAVELEVHLRHFYKGLEDD